MVGAETESHLPGCAWNISPGRSAEPGAAALSNQSSDATASCWLKTLKLWGCTVVGPTVRDGVLSQMVAGEDGP